MTWQHFCCCCWCNLTWRIFCYKKDLDKIFLISENLLQRQTLKLWFFILYFSLFIIIFLSLDSEVLNCNHKIIFFVIIWKWKARKQFWFLSHILATLILCSWKTLVWKSIIVWKMTANWKQSTIFILNLKNIFVH